MQRQGILLAHLALLAAHTGRQERAQTLIDGQTEPMTDAARLRVSICELQLQIGLKTSAASELRAPVLLRESFSRKSWRAAATQVKGISKRRPFEEGDRSAPRPRARAGSF